MKTLTLLLNEFGDETVAFENVRMKLFGCSNKEKFKKLIAESTELKTALDDSQKNFSLFGLAHLIDRKRNLSSKNLQEKNMLNTRIGLYEQYGSAIIDFEDIREMHLGCSHDVAKKKIKSGELPLVTFRLVDSQKMKLLVHVDDLAALLETQRTKAREQLKNLL